MAKNFSKGEEVFFNYHGKMIPYLVVSIKRDGRVVLASHYHTQHIITQRDFSNYFNGKGENLNDNVVRTYTNREWHGNNGKPLIDWVREVLEEFGRPMHYSEIREAILDRGYTCPIEPNEDRTPIECRIKTRIVEALERGDDSIIKVGPATYKINS